MEGLVKLRGRHTPILPVEQSPHFIERVVHSMYSLEQGAVAGHGKFTHLGSRSPGETYVGVKRRPNVIVSRDVRGRGHRKQFNTDFVRLSRSITNIVHGQRPLGPLASRY